MLTKLKRFKEQLLILLLTLPFTYLSYLYFKSENLKVYDAPGHLQLVWQIKNYLWPFPNGWNSFSLLGFDQGRFYPPLFHYLVANLSFFLSIDLATKLVLAVAIISLPISIYLFISTLTKDLRERLFLTGSLLVGLVVLPGYLGSNIKALTQVGLLTSFVSLPLLFLYFNQLLRIKKTGWIIPSFLLAGVFLTHLVAGVVGLIFLFSFLVTSFLQKNLTKDFVYHTVASLGLTAFFLVPFIVNLEFLSNSIHLSSFGLINLFSLLVSGLFIFVFYKTRNWLLLTIALNVFLLSLGTSIDFINERFFSFNSLYQKIYSLHLYRFQIYQYFLLVILILYFPSKFLFSVVGRKKNRLYLAAGLPAFAIAVIFIIRSPILVEQSNLSLKEDQEQGGRFIESFSRQTVYPYIYEQQYQLIKNQKQPWAYGLFTDSTPNGPFLSSLIRSLNPEDFQTSKTKLIEAQVIKEAKVKPTLDLFAIENILVINPTFPVRGDGIDLTSLDRGEQKLVEIPNQEIKHIEKNWINEVENWWGREDFKQLLVRGKSFPLETAEGEKPTVSLENFDENFTKFTLKINSSETVPVLIKLGYSPNWVASQNGKNLQIYQTSPSLMLVYGNGDIDFQYKRLWYENLTLMISLLSVIVLVLLKLRSFKNDFKR